ncbi:MAG: hypothetical protein ACQEQJ_00700 [Halobacteriota archaeon]
MTTYYDFVLGLIPLVLLGFGGGLRLAGLRFEIAVAVGGLLAMGLIGHALFVNAPVDSTTQPSSTESVSTGTSAPMAD